LRVPRVKSKIEVLSYDVGKELTERAAEDHKKRTEGIQSPNRDICP
jgi:hypothetical protein